MKKTKLFVLLCLLKSEEIPAFNTFVRKQLRKDSHPEKLWRLIYKSYKLKGDWDGLHTESSKLYQKLHPKDTRVDKAKFNNARSRLIQLLKNFLSQNWLENNPLEEERIFLEVLRERGAVKGYFRIAEQLRSQLSNQEDQSILNRFWSFYIEHGLYFQRTGLGIYTDDNFNALYQALQRLLFKLQVSYALEDTLRQNTRGDSQQHLSLREVLKRYPELHTSNAEEWEVYVSILSFEQQPDKANWERCMQLFLLHKRYLDKGEQSLLLTWLINAGYSLQLTQEENIRADLLQLYRCALREEMLLNENLHLHPQHLLNAAVLARSEQDRLLLQELRDSYLQLLHEDEENNIEALINAFIAFIDKSYEETLRNLQYVRFSNISYSLLSYELEIKCQIEFLLLDEEEQLEETLQRFSAYLRRRQEELPKQIYRANRNFIRACRDIQRRYVKGRLQEEVAAYSTVLEEPQLVARHWLQEKWKAL